MSRQTKYYLATAEQTLFIFSQSNDVKDFSVIGLEYCKALELELNKKFVLPFVDYIQEKKVSFLNGDKTGTRNNKPKYHSYLSMVVDDVNYPEIKFLTLGQIPFLINKCLTNEYSLLEYKRFIEQRLDSCPAGTLELISHKLGTVVKKYRNAIAHGASINKVECEHLRDLIFAGDNALLPVCCHV